MFASLPGQIVQGILNALYGAFTGLVDFGDVAITDVEHAIEQFIVTTGNSISDLVSTTEHLAAEIETAVANAITTAVNDVTGLFTEAITASEDVIGYITGIFKAILGLLGNPSVGSGNGTPINAAAPNNLQLLLGLLNTTTPIPTALFQALSPSTSKNVLNDPGFDNNNPVYGATGISDLQGQGLWCYDGWIGRNKPGSVRTIRPGLITIYYVVGTTQTTTPGSNPWQTMAYLASEEYSFIIEWLLTGTDQTHFEWVLVPYPAAVFWMSNSVNIGVSWLVNQIKQTPGKFILVGDSQGGIVCSDVYDQIRYGSLQDRRKDFLGGVMTGNLRREEGRYFPGMPENLKSPGTSGMCDVCPPIGPYGGQGNPFNPKGGNLIDTEDIWWEMAAPGDYFACTPISTELGLWLRIVIDFVFQDINGDIQAGIDLLFQHGIIGGIIAIIVDVITAVQVIFSEFPINSPHNSYWSAKPIPGDDRTYAEIGLDYISSFADQVDPPINGVQHQLLGQRIIVQPFQVVTAGAYACWVNVQCEGPAIQVAVNAYDEFGDLLATVTSPDATISSPEPSSNWQFIQIKGDFVMPEGAATACINFVVQEQAMRTGIVWFDDAEFEVDNLIDAALLGNIPGIPQLDATSVAGIQGMADMATAIQHVIDSLASANNQNTVTGVELAAMFQSQAQLALNASDSYNLGVVNNQLVSNPSVQPIYNGLQPTGECSFPLTSFTPGDVLPSQSLSAGETISCFINCGLPAKKGFIEFIAKGVGGSGVYVNVYEVDQDTGAWTNKWSSSDISSNIPNGTFGWVSLVIGADEQISVTQGEVVAIEIVAQNTSLDVAAQTWAIPNRTSTIASNIGTTRDTSAKGLSPASLTTDDLTYNGIVAWVDFGVKDVPPNYEPPNQTSFLDGPGIYDYTVPDWFVSGNLLDLVGLGGGGGGGDYANNANGQGGAGGQFAGTTAVWGTDIPEDKTDLKVIVGGYGVANSLGCTTAIGYDLGNTPQFDAVGEVAVGTNVPSLSFTFEATEGACVIIAVTWTGQINGFAYGNVTHDNFAGFTQAGVNLHATGMFGLLNAPGGAQTVELSAQSGTNFGYISAVPISYTGVDSATTNVEVEGLNLALATMSVGGRFNSNGKSTTPSITTGCASGQLVVQAFGCGDQSANLSGFTGGTLRAYGINGTKGAISVSDATENTVFGATASASIYWGSVAMVLNPILGTKLMTAPGGWPGAPGGAWPTDGEANTNTGTAGLSPGTFVFAGRSYYGGPSSAIGASFPGGGSPGGTASALPGPAANGAAWITARQS
ncbi:hypothetical protein [Mycobacterium intracellulare]|uniref:hypothetical protein n=1 Tax=Mycobacterium intracellulare TaxID=1767 RepID=UPI001926FDF2|nr:hypothetical protein [Mycobacterium intracellulare]